jgi:hypothetical protein
MRKIALALAGAAAISITSSANATTTVFTENFGSGLGVFTATGQVGINTGTGYISCCGTTGSPANMANPFVAFGSGDLPSGTITSTAFNTLAGEQYHVTFDVGALGAGTETVFLMVGSASVPFLAPANNNLDFAFHPAEAVFVGTGGLMTISFSSSGLPGVDAIIDNITLISPVDLPPPGVPEPATWTMMVIGFAAIGFKTRRRKSALQSV